jgi:hypothetical protein
MMNATLIRTFFIAALVAIFITSVMAQSPAPIVVQAASATTAVQVAAPPPALPAADLSETTKVLQEIKAANAETLKKQEAVLQQLDELQKAAQQIKIFAHRS